MMALVWVKGLCCFRLFTSKKCSGSNSWDVHAHFVGTVGNNPYPYPSCLTVDIHILLTLFTYPWWLTIDRYPSTNLGSESPQQEQKEPQKMISVRTPSAPLVATNRWGSPVGYNWSYRHGKAIAQLGDLIPNQTWLVRHQVGWGDGGILFLPTSTQYLGP